MRIASRKASNHGDLRPIWADVGMHRPRGVVGNERLMFDTSRVQPARSIQRDHKPGDSRSDTAIFSLPSIHATVGTGNGCDDRRATMPRRGNRSECLRAGLEGGRAQRRGPPRHRLHRYEWKALTLAALWKLLGAHIARRSRGHLAPGLRFA